jgi:hypothetical protein
MKMSVCWDVAPCSLVEVYNVSEVLTASMIRAMSVAPCSFVETDRRSDMLTASILRAMMEAVNTLKHLRILPQTDMKSLLSHI